jgi:uncharacterized protein (DUF433 family)
MNYRDHISSNPKVMLGKPCIKGTRITVELVLEKLSEGATPQDILTMYPHLNSDDISAVLMYAADMVANEVFAPVEE